MKLCQDYPAQIVALAAQISWSGSVQSALNATGADVKLQDCLNGLAWRLLAMSESVLGESPPAQRKKYEQLITELVRQRDATRRLQVMPLCSLSDIGGGGERWFLIFYSKNFALIGFRISIELETHFSTLDCSVKDP